VRCNATKYFEYYAYKELSKLSPEVDLQDVDYVMITGYKTIAPSDWGLKYDHFISYPTDDRVIQKAIYFALNNSNYDVLPFFPAGSTVLKRITQTQGNQGLKALQTALKAIKWTNSEISDSVWAQDFVRNTYLAKTQTFLGLARIMAALVEAVETDEVLEKEFRHPAKSHSHTSLLAFNIYGTHHFQLHGTVMESAVPVVLDHMKVKVSSIRFEG
jgi:hypothetical protein